jgi:hypothetical protein
MEISPKIKVNKNFGRAGLRAPQAFEIIQTSISPKPKDILAHGSHAGGHGGPPYRAWEITGYYPFRPYYIHWNKKARPPGRASKKEII